MFGICQLLIWIKEKYNKANKENQGEAKPKLKPKKLYINKKCDTLSNDCICTNPTVWMVATEVHQGVLSRNRPRPNCHGN